MAGKSRTSSSGSRVVRAVLRAVTGTGRPVTFQFNPGKVGIAKQTKTEGKNGVVANSYEEAIRASGNLTITLGDVKFAGLSTMGYVNTLLSWTNPIVGTAGAVGGTRLPAAGSTTPGGGGSGTGGGLGGVGAVASPTLTKTPAGTGGAGGTSGSSGPGGAGGGGGKPGSGGSAYLLPVLDFTWGRRGLSYEVTLEQVNVTYERFTSAGAPVLATVSLVLKQHTEVLKSTNPTSGGLADRGRHTVTSTDSIIRIANDVYHTPHAWRALAEANRLDDPLRIKPGQRLYLPSPGELEEAMD